MSEQELPTITIERTADGLETTGVLVNWERLPGTRDVEVVHRLYEPPLVKVTFVARVEFKDIGR